jgi:hypothetical protein
MLRVPVVVLEDDKLVVNLGRGEGDDEYLVDLVNLIKNIKLHRILPDGRVTVTSFEDTVKRMGQHDMALMSMRDAVQKGLMTCEFPRMQGHGGGRPTKSRRPPPRRRRATRRTTRLR